MDKFGCPFGGIEINPPVLNFTMMEGSPTPPAVQCFWIRTTDAGVVNPRWTAVVDVPWIQLTPNHGVSPTQVWVHVDSVGMSAGDYEAHETVNSDETPNAPQVGTIKLSVTPKPAPLKIITTTIPDGIQGELYQCQIQIEGGTPPYNVTCGGLPDGVTFDPQTYLISGTPTVSSEFTITISVQDSDMGSVTTPYQLNITHPPAKVAITWPMGGETVYVGDTRDITWVTDRDMDDTIDIFLSVNGTWITLATVPIKDHSYPWLVDASQVCDDAYVKLQAPGNAPQSGPFSIKANTCPILDWIIQFFSSIKRKLTG